MVTVRDLVRFMEQLRIILYEATHVTTRDPESHIPSCLRIHIIKANRNVGYPINNIQISVMYMILKTFIEWRYEEEGHGHVMPCLIVFDSLQTDTVILDTITMLLYNVLT